MENTQFFYLDGNVWVPSSGDIVEVIRQMGNYEWYELEPKLNEAMFDSYGKLRCSDIVYYGKIYTVYATIYIFLDCSTKINIMAFGCKETQIRTHLLKNKIELYQKDLFRIDDDKQVSIITLEMIKNHVRSSIHNEFNEGSYKSLYNMMVDYETIVDYNLYTKRCRELLCSITSTSKLF